MQHVRDRDQRGSLHRCRNDRPSLRPLLGSHCEAVLKLRVSWLLIWNRPIRCRAPPRILKKASHQDMIDPGFDLNRLATHYSRKGQPLRHADGFVLCGCLSGQERNACAEEQWQSEQHEDPAQGHASNSPEDDSRPTQCSY
jgi:hypothetical protein